ncbi:chemotaxis protein CheW [Nitrococcus mobilis]|uniref:Twitching motility protein PilI n=1 Tax=Nitrococcus mobilis Nb-231 TaxID=314278 RepID=A4BSC0_9GAMM|nr:chemotaxis protein CheW [Nitrococcus mobilis]EAR21380.1 twitching motility protein PilI [Nitrococcus mobilis Nb-231]
MVSRQSAPTHPFELLARLERLARAHRAESADREKKRDEWRGVGFRLGGQRFVAPLGEVVEILTPPRVARVPHTKSWVSGVANVRGNLLPIMDLNAYLGKGPINLNRLSRVLVIEREAGFTGLLVDEVLGMCHFLYPEQWRVLVDPGMEQVAPYLDGVLHRDGSDWLIFRLTRLTQHPKFLKVAA